MNLIEKRIDKQWVDVVYKKYNHKLSSEKMQQNVMSGDVSDAENRYDLPTPETMYKILCCIDICEALYNEGVIDFYTLKHSIFGLKNYAQQSVT